MSKHSVAAQVIEACVRRIQLALGGRNREEAVSAVDEALKNLPGDAIADTAGIGELGLDPRTCNALRAIDVCTVGELRDLGFDRLKSSPGIGTARAQNIKSALRSFKVCMTRSGRKG